MANELTDEEVKMWAQTEGGRLGPAVLRILRERDDALARLAARREPSSTFEERAARNHAEWLEAVRDHDG